MSATQSDGWAIYGPPVRGRQCGSCRMCCTAIPTDLPEGRKPANVRCRHLTSRGCGIYDHRPDPCQYWSCRWLMDASTATLRRPDQSGYIVDPVTDTIIADGQAVKVLQIWVDPKRPDAHRDPALRSWLEDIYSRWNLVALVRWGSAAGVLLAPPKASSTGDWLELGDQTSRVSSEEMNAKLAAAGVTRFL